MEQNFQTSFIPKKPIVKNRVVSSRPVGILLVASLFILFTVLIATGGLYFYQLSVSKSIPQLQSQLDLAKSSFEPSEITKLQVLDKRLTAATEILNNHVAVTPIFEALETATLKTVRYTKFSYTLGATPTAPVTVQISGQAIGYRSIALESDLLGQNKNIIDPVFSNLTLDDQGQVIFDLDFTVDPSFVNYKQNLLATSPAQS